VRRLAGQAARHGGRALHALAQIALGLVVAAAVGLGAAAWRLSRGPVEIPVLIPALEAAANADLPAHLTVGGAALAWEGFREGLDQPLDIRLGNVVLTDRAGRRIFTVPQAAVALSPGSLLLGRLVPRAIELDGVRLHVLRGTDGTLRLDLPTPEAAESAANLPQVLRELAARPVTDVSSGGGSRWGQLRRVRIRDAALTVTDQQVGTDWAVPSLDIDLHRHRAGGVAGTLSASVVLGGLGIRLSANATLDAAGRETGVRFHLTPVVPAELARVLPPAAPLAAIDAPVALSGSLALGPDLHLAQITLVAEMGAGALHIGQGTAPVLAAQAVVQGTPARFVADLGQLVTTPTPDGPRTTISGHAEVVRSATEVSVAATLDLDQVAFADLPALWPAGIGGPGTRPWITANITDGIAHGFHVELALTAPPDLSDATLTHIAGGGEGSDLTVHWLRPVPPITRGAVRLTFLTPDSLEVVATAGQETIGHDTIAVRGGRVLFTGIAAKDQFADITGDLAGPIPAALGLLGQPRIGLLSRSPLRVQNAAGQFAGRIEVTHLPLRDDLRMDDVQIRTALKLTGAHIPGIVAGRDLDRGALDLTADSDGLHVAGRAALAGIPAQLQADMDFRAGPPTQVLQTVSVSGTVDAAQLASLGLDAGSFASGAAQVDAQLTMRRNNTGQASLHADLAGMALALDSLNWRKPRGAPAQAEAQVRLNRDQIAGIDLLQITGDGVRLAASAAFADGQPSLIRLDRLALDQATDLRGTVRVPSRPGDAWRADLTGRSLDASALLRRKPEPRPTRPTPAGPPYAIDARFDQVVLGPGHSLAAVSVRAENDGRIMRHLDLAGQTKGARAFRLQIVPAGSGRRLAGDAADTGALLRILGVLSNMEGGRLALSGSYDDTAPDHPLTARAEITDFRMHHAPVLAKLLQAMTLYGLVDVMQGPGLGFSRLIAPFRLTGDVLELHDVRAFSPSLGMTAKGQVDLARQEFDLEGTIVPAYFFNSLLGNLPLVGRLFSPERGGGVFAATYTLRGPMDDPRISVNPLAALTPGFLRGLFGLFEGAAPSQ
jgi:hypothetical protein